MGFDLELFKEVMAVLGIIVLAMIVVVMSIVLFCSLDFPLNLTSPMGFILLCGALACIRKRPK